MTIKSVVGGASPGKILSDVSLEKAFHFHTGIGMYTGKYATSLVHFSRILEQIDSKSIEFHLTRKDFENWIRFLGDNALSLQLAKLRKKNVAGEKLRAEVLKVVRARLDRPKSP